MDASTGYSHFVSTAMFHRWKLPPLRTGPRNGRKMPPGRMRFPRVVIGLCGWSLLILVLLSAFPCTDSEAAPRARPDLAGRLESIRTIGLIPPEIRIYELSAGGMQEERDDWSVAGKANMTRGILDAFGERKIVVSPIQVEENRQEEIEDIRSLYQAVVLSILLHSDGPNAFPAERQRFDFALGSLETLYDAIGVDALLFVYGRDEISTGGRKTLAVLGLAAGVVFRPGISVLGIGLVDRSGNLLWYNSDYSPGMVDFRDPESASKFSKKLLSDFPAPAK